MGIEASPLKGTAGNAGNDRNSPNSLLYIGDRQFLVAV